MNPNLVKIITFAIDSHAKTNHKYDGYDYSVHLAMVVSYVYKYIDYIPKEHREAVIGAAWLHDTIEDARLTYNDVLKVAGKDVAEIVYALTNDKGKNRKERAGERYYQGIREVPYADFVKLCDRLANVSYSVTTGSKMQEVYKKENPEFLSRLVFSKRYSYPDMIDELCNYFK